MLTDSASSKLNDLDRRVFHSVVPADHYLWKVSERINFERFRPTLEDSYSRTLGRPPIDVVRMLKLMVL